MLYNKTKPHQKMQVTEETNEYGNKDVKTFTSCGIYDASPQQAIMLK